MPRRRSSWNRARRDLYLTQRAMGDATAARRGRLGARLGRRYLIRALTRLLRS